MYANYHTHTWRCHHAQPDENSYVRAAISRGLKTLGFSDHTPYPFSKGFHSSFRMEPEMLPDYCRTIEALKGQYRDSIRVEIGLEAEYYPKYFKELKALLRDTPVTYLLLGQHYVGNETDGVYSGTPTADPETLKAYCRQTRDGMQTGLFTYLAHPDLLYFTGNDRLYRQEMSGLFQDAKSCGMPLEVNLLGLSDRRHYPSKRFLELAAEENCPVIFGCDAHEPGALSDTSPEAQAKKLIAPYGLTLLNEIPLRNIQNHL